MIFPTNKPSQNIAYIATAFFIVIGFSWLYFIGVMAKELWIISNPAKACDGVLRNILREASRNNMYVRNSSVMQNFTLRQSDVFIAYYPVKGDVLLDGVFSANIPDKYKTYQQDTTYHQELWEHFVLIVPPSQRSEVKHLFFYTDNKDVKKEKDNSLAYVEWYGNKSVKLAIDLVDAKDQSKYRMTKVYVHELAHIVTRGSTQIKTKTYEKCETYSPGYSKCTYPNSYINEFYNSYWLEIQDEWAKVSELGNEYESHRFYLKYSDQFLNEYASTNINEDLAESWTYFVLAPRSDGESISERKTQFFYNYAELVDLREQLQDNICKYYGIKQ